MAKRTKTARVLNWLSDKWERATPWLVTIGMVIQFKLLHETDPAPIELVVNLLRSILCFLADHAESRARDDPKR
jgi:hypothetical protein